VNPVFPVVILFLSVFIYGSFFVWRKAGMPDETFLFLDFDNTLSDMDALGAQYVQAVAILLAHEFGGEAGAWATVTAPALRESKTRYEAAFVDNPLGGFAAWVEAERVQVAEAIFAGVGKALPKEETVSALAKRVQFDALKGCNAVFPGAEETLRVLRKAGLRVQMASSQESEYLRAALMGAGLEGYVEELFGPDLVDCAKEGPEFYQRLFAECGIRPAQAVVVDDQALCLDWAEEVGARVIQACLKPDSPEPEFPFVLTRFTDLPPLIGV
jgi:phosphoglycolate phosphatase-like HAD superfamily hydrolase